MTATTAQQDTYEIWLGIQESLPIPLWMLVVDQLTNGLVENPEQLNWHMRAAKVLVSKFNRQCQLHIGCAVCGNPNKPRKNPAEILSLDEDVFVRHAMWLVYVLVMGVYDFEKKGRSLESNNFNIRTFLVEIRAMLTERQETPDDAALRLKEHLAVAPGDTYSVPVGLPDRCPRCQQDWREALLFPYLYWLRPAPPAVEEPEPDFKESDRQAIVVSNIEANWGRVPLNSTVVYVGEFDQTFSLIMHKGRRRKVLATSIMPLGEPVWAT